MAENIAFTPNDPGLGNITLDPKKIGALTLVAREAIEDSNPDVRMVVANSLIRDTSIELDRQFVVGDGTGQDMKGLLNITGTTAGPSTGTNGGSLSATGNWVRLPSGHPGRLRCRQCGPGSRRVDYAFA